MGTRYQGGAPAQTVLAASGGHVPSTPRTRFSPGGTADLMHLPTYVVIVHIISMLQLYTSEEFAAWFAELDDTVAEVIATALDVVQELGPGQSAPGSTEWLLWYGVPEAPHFGHLEQWSAFRDEAKRALEHLASPRFLARFARLGAPEAAHVSRAIEHIKTMAGVNRKGLLSAMHQGGAWLLRDKRSEMVSSYRAALIATGLDEADFPAHSDAVRELTLEAPLPPRWWLHRSAPPRRSNRRLTRGRRCGSSMG